MNWLNYHIDIMKNYTWYEWVIFILWFIVSPIIIIHVVKSANKEAKKKPIKRNKPH